MKILFEAGEYTINGSSVEISLGVIKEKVESRALRRTVEGVEAINSHRVALADEGLDLAALDWWINLHSQIYKKGITPAKILGLVLAIEDILKKSPVEAVNLSLLLVAAMGKPKKCTLPYLRTVIAEKMISHRDTEATENKNLPPCLRVSVANSTPEEIWQIVKRKLEQRINGPSFNTWLRPAQFIGCSEGILRVGVPDEGAVFWVSRYYSVALRDAWEEAGGEAVRVEITTGVAHKQG